MTDKGHCKHGVFDLEKGCPQCIAERQGVSPSTEPEPAASALSERVGEPVTITDKLLEETALALRPGEDIEVHGYFEESMKLLEYAEARVITTTEDAKLANDDLVIIGQLKRSMEGKRKEYLEPLKAQTDAIREAYTYLMTPVLEADKITRDKMLVFAAEQRRIRLEQEEINRKRMEAAQAEMKLKGELTEPVNLVKVSPEAKRVSTELGTTGMTDHWKYEVFDFALLPDEYKVADSAMLNTIAKKHHDRKEIPGVRFYNEPFLAVRTR